MKSLLSICLKRRRTLEWTIVVFYIDMHQHLCKVEDETRANCAKTVQKKNKRTNKPGWVDEELSLASGTGINTFLFINWLSSIAETGPEEKGPTEKKKKKETSLLFLSLSMSEIILALFFLPFLSRFCTYTYTFSLFYFYPILKVVVLYTSPNGFLGLPCLIFFSNFICIFSVYGKIMIKQNNNNKD